LNQNQLAEHIDSHFNDQHQPQQPPAASKLLSRIGSADGHSISSMSSTSSSSSSSTAAAVNHNQRHNNDFLMAQELERRDRLVIFCN
jgi:2-methylaconitate cis-trans-isomerase PrpF